MLVRDRAGNAQGVTLTGWTALAGIAALIVLVMFSASYAWGKYRGASKDGYTLVVKKGGGR
jgi:Golgi apparatus protein 1